jgi:hypothetical protein
MRTLPFLIAMTLFAAVPLWAQRVSGEGTCGKPEVDQEVPIGDRPDHSFSVSKNNCTWTKPFEIAGEKAQGGTAVQMDERSGNTSRFRGHYLDTMAGGDTVHYRYEGTTTFKDRTTPESVAWTWTIANGSGKLKGLTGKGTCKGSWATGTYRWSCTGAYRLRR